MLSPDALIVGFDRALRTVAGVVHAARPRPDAALTEGELDAEARAHAARLMRVNHCGEVCAQALYQGQAVCAHNPAIRDALQHSADEELDHLAWSAARIEELGGRTSVFNPLWYVGSLGIGVLASRFGQAWNLGFLAETEHQVEAHLQSHLARLDPKDVRTRALIEQMRVDEAAHAANALSLGAAELPAPVKTIMRAVASVMTSASYRL